MRPLSIQAGYRYLNLAGKDGNRDNTIADGPYIGASASFNLFRRGIFLLRQIFLLVSIPLCVIVFLTWQARSEQC